MDDKDELISLSEDDFKDDASVGWVDVNSELSSSSSSTEDDDNDDDKWKKR
jgi:hypothetical protein